MEVANFCAAMDTLIDQDEEDPDRYQNIISSFYHPRLLQRISLQSIHRFFSNAAHKQKDRHLDEQFNTRENIISFANEVINVGPWFCKVNPKASGSLLASQSGHATTIMVFLTHFLILEDPNRHKNLIGSLLYHPRPCYTISLQSVQDLLSNVAH